MRLLTFGASGARPGAELRSGDIIDLAEAFRDSTNVPLRSIAELLAMGAQGLRLAASLIGSAETDPQNAERRSWIVPAADIELLPPMGAKVLIVATSGYFNSHLAEMKVSARSKASSFVVSPNSLIGSGAAIHLPSSNPDMVDWEGELGVVIGSRCHSVAPKYAMSHVAGYTIFNDISARDHVGATRSSDPAEAIAAWRANLLFKQFPTFGPIGPVIVTTDEIPDPAQLELTTMVNGQVMQHDIVGNMRSTVAEIVSEASRVHSFEPGDVITTGTPAGVGIAHDPPRFLHEGDEIVVAVTRIGVLRNSVIRGASR